MSLPQIHLLSAARRKSLRIPFAARRVDRAGLATLIEGDAASQPGDVALMRVEELGQHQQLELSSGRKARLFEGDEIVLVYGNRYAPDPSRSPTPIGT